MSTKEEKEKKTDAPKSAAGHALADAGKKEAKKEGEDDGKGEGTTADNKPKSDAPAAVKAVENTKTPDEAAKEVKRAEDSGANDDTPDGTKKVDAPAAATVIAVQPGPTPDAKPTATVLQAAPQVAAAKPAERKVRIKMLRTHKVFFAGEDGGNRELKKDQVVEVGMDMAQPLVNRQIATIIG